MNYVHILTQKVFGVVLSTFILLAPFAYASDMTSSNFIIRDPLVGTGGSYGSSASFKMLGSGDMTNIGRATSTNFEGRYGFLWLPYVTQGVFSVVANGSEANLSWSASVGGLGWFPSGYRVGSSITPGGPYSFISVGSVTSYIDTGLAPGVHCYVLQTTNTDNSVIATSEERCINISLIGNNGGGGLNTDAQSRVRFSGLAYPKAVVTLQNLGSTIATTVADSRGLFFIEADKASSQLFTLFATSTAGKRSTILNFPLTVHSGSQMANISGIKFAPTIFSDRSFIKKGDPVVISGEALPEEPVQIIIEGAVNKNLIAVSDIEGNYKTTVPFTFNDLEYFVRAKYDGDQRSSKALKISIGNIPIVRSQATDIPGDCNLDSKVTLVDFSVLAYWYQKPNPPKCLDTNADNIINLVDFSIMAFYWNN